MKVPFLQRPFLLAPKILVTTPMPSQNPFTNGPSNADPSAHVNIPWPYFWPCL